MVTRDEYRLPIMVVDSVTELARRTGKSPDNISSYISKWKRGQMDNSPFIKVQIEEEERE